MVISGYVIRVAGYHLLKLRDRFDLALLFRKLKRERVARELICRVCRDELF
jgi:hypothetical protein